VEEACAREEAAKAEHPEEMSMRCDAEGAPFTTWYRRHRGEKAAAPDRYGSGAALVATTGIEATTAEASM
jgi:hypothetical protein